MLHTTVKIAKLKNVLFVILDWLLKKTTYPRTRIEVIAIPRKNISRLGKSAVVM